VNQKERGEVVDREQNAAVALGESNYGKKANYNRMLGVICSREKLKKGQNHKNEEEK